MGHKKYWKLDRNVLIEDQGIFQGWIPKNRELGSRRSNIAKKKLTEWDKTDLEVKKRVLKGDSRSSERMKIKLQSGTQEVLKIGHKCFDRGSGNISMLNSQKSRIGSKKI